MSDTETMIKVMSAYVDGGMIEYRNKMFGGDWTPITKTVPLWNWPLTITGSSQKKRSL